MQLAGKFFDPESFEINLKRYSSSERNDEFKFDVKDSGVTKETFKITALFEKTYYPFFRNLLMQTVNFSYEETYKEVIITQINPKFMAGFVELSFTLEEV